MSKERQQDRIMHLLLSEGLANQSPPDLSLRIFATAFPEPTIASIAALEPDEISLPLPTFPTELPTLPRLPVIAPKPMPKQVAAPAKPTRRPLIFRLAKPLAAAAMLVFVIGLFMYVNRPYPQPTVGGDSNRPNGPLARGSQIFTTGKTARIVLGGSYQLDLAPKTKLTINGAPHAEAVTLDDGQISCDLGSDLGDLIITSEAGTITASDARFSAALHDDDMPTVTSGKGETNMGIHKKLLVAVFSGIVTVSGSWGQTSFAAGADHAFTADGPVPVAAAATTPPSTAATRIAGTIASVSNDSVGVALAGGTTVSVTVGNTTTIKLSDKPATLADLKPGMNVVIYISATSTQIIASVSPTPKPPATAAINVTGTIAAIGDGTITIKSSTKTTVVAVTDSTIVKIKDVVATLADLKTGMTILAITTDGKTATEIHAYVPTTPPTPTPTPPPVNTTYTGTIVTAADDQITIHTNAGTIVVTVNDQTIIRIKDVLSTFADLKPGMNISAAANPNKLALEIHAYVPNTPPTPTPTPPASTTIGGTLTAITGDTITIADGGRSTTLAFTTTTTFNVNGVASGPTALKTGMHIYATTTTDGKTATIIRAISPTPTTPPPATTTLTGTITTISATQIGIQSATRTNILAVTSATIFKLNGNVVGRGDLKTGMSVTVLTADGKTATEVRAISTATTGGTVNGVVSQIAGTQITITDGTKVTVVTFNTATTFTINGAASNAESLKAGMHISAAITDGKLAKTITAYTPTSATNTK